MEALRNMSYQDVFGLCGLFSRKTDFVQFLRYMTGLLMPCSEKRTMDGINKLFCGKLAFDQSTMNRFLTKSPWQEAALTERRIEQLKAHPMLRPWYTNTVTCSWSNGMNSSAIDMSDARAQRITVSDEALTVDLVAERTLIVPLVWYPRLWHGTPEERNRFEIFGDGAYIHWPNLSA